MKTLILLILLLSSCAPLKQHCNTNVYADVAVFMQTNVYYDVYGHYSTDFDIHRLWLYDRPVIIYPERKKGSVPEPGTLFLLGAGMVCLAGIKKLKKKSR